MGSLRIPDIILAGALVLVLGLAAPIGDAQAQSVSSPVSLFSNTTPHSTVGVIAGEAMPGGEFSAGVQIKLQPGWKTYWRTPGDSGMPPSFDWSQSENLAAAEIEWPAPTRFSEHGETIYGYRDEVIFPVMLTPQDANQPIKLALSLFYAVCKEICIPVQTEIAVQLVPAEIDREAARAISRFAARVPKPEVKGLALRSASVEKSGAAEPSLILEVATDDRTTPIDIIVEADKSGISFGAPVKLAEQGADQRFKVTVDGKVAAEQLQGASVGLTIVQGNKALAKSVMLK